MCEVKKKKKKERKNKLHSENDHYVQFALYNILKEARKSLAEGKGR